MNETTPNPFDPCTPASGASFFGREDELSWIREGVERAAKLLLHSVSGMGTTSLLGQSAGQLASGPNGVRVVGIDLARYANLEQLIVGVRKAALPLMASGPADPGGVFGDLPGAIRGSVAPALDEQAAGMGPIGMLAMLDRLNLHARNRGQPTVVMIEHYEHVRRFAAPQLETGLQGALAGHRSLTYIVAGDERAIRQLGAQSASDAGGQSEMRRLGALPPHGFGRWIEEQFAQRKISAPGVGSACVDNAGPRTGDIVELARRTFVMAEITRFANRATVEQALEQSISEKSGEFLQRWEGLSIPERSVVTALAAGKGRRLLESEGFRAAGLTSDKELKTALSSLQQKQIVEPTGTLDVQLSSPLFRGWTLQARMTWQKKAGDGAVAEAGPRFAFNFNVGRQERPARTQTVGATL